MAKPLSDETRVKISQALRGRRQTVQHVMHNAAARRGRPLSENHKRNLSAAKLRLGLKHTREWRAASSERLRVLWAMPEYREGQLRNLRKAASRPKSDSHKAKLSAAKRGVRLTAPHRVAVIAALRGRRFSEGHKAKLGLASKRRWADVEYRQRVVRAVMAAARSRPTRPERVMGELLEGLFPGEYLYVGDGQLLIGGRCPDFANINGQKKLVEVFGNYWHREEDPLSRIAYFEKWGYQTLVIWEAELDDIGSVTARVERFHGP